MADKRNPAEPRITKAGNVDKRTLRRGGAKPIELVMSARELRLPPELHNVLVLISKQTGMTNQALIREAVTIWAFNIGAIKSVEDVPVTTYRYRARYNNKKKEIAP